MRRTIWIGMLLACVCAVYAQSITSYSCDFENPAENALWSLNPVASGRNIADCVNKWYIGPAGGYGMGATSVSSGLYISSGTGADTLVSSYSRSQSVFVAATRNLQLAAGSYSIVFDWEAMGGGATDGVYVCWLEDPDRSTNANWSNRTNLTLPNYFTNITRYGGSDTWRSSAFTFSTMGNGGKLVVLWLNSRTQVAEPAGKVDNICIYQGATCPAPSNVTYNGDTKSVTWSGNASSYDVQLYNYNTQTLSSYTGVTSHSMQIPALSEEGYYYISVRSVCGDGHSVWTSTGAFVWIKGARCIDLFDIGPSLTHAGVAYTGEFNDFIRYNRQGTLDMDDFGPSDPASTHTIHINRNEIDPNTKVAGGLHVVPPGEIASIRLGAYTSAGKSSRLEYKYTVLPGMSDLFDLKYAVVMESGGHGSSLSDYDMNPTFTLNILDGQGRELDACTQRYFVAGFGDQSSWHQEVYDPDIYWCDWQTVTVSLRRYIGQTITIRLTSTRCSYDTHPAYAYFTFNCRGGDLQGLACGDYSTDHFEAPEGFNYRWYSADDPNKTTVLSTDRDFHISRTSDTIYLVDLISRTNPTCYYTLEANPNPRFPQARASRTSSTVANCEHLVSFKQDCHVVRINRVTHDSVFTDEPVESIVWDFGDGSAPLVSLDENVSHAFPPQGGTFNVTVKASMSNGVCEDVHTFPVTLPDITTKDTYNDTHYCGEGVNYSDTTTMTNAHGCEYHAIRRHIYHPLYDTLYTERMCEGGRYLFPGNGRYYTSTIDTTVHLQSQYGCDSTIRLSLLVDPKLAVDYPESLKVCLEDNAIIIPYKVISGILENVRVLFSERDQERGFQPVYTFAAGEAIRIPLPAGVRPDRYSIQLDFSSERCQMAIQTLPVMLTYPSSIVKQKNGFIAVQNEDYNGGYKFTSFVWTKDGETLNTSASYVPASADDLGATYVLNLQREGEDYTVESCPIIYNAGAQGIEDVVADSLRVWPTSVQSGGSLWLAPEACAIYSVLGTKVAQYEPAATVRSVTAPAQPGVYVVVFDNHQSSSIIVR